jgi:hypothetical protein
LELFELDADEPNVVDLLEGEYAFSAAIIWVGVTETVGALRRSVSEDDARARSMAPRRTSNRLLTSPVSAAIFFDRRESATGERNLFITSLVSVVYKGERREWMISRSCVDGYGVKCIVLTLTASASPTEEDVRVCVLAIPMTRTFEDGNENNVVSDCAVGAT